MENCPAKSTLLRVISPELLREFLRAKTPIAPLAVFRGFAGWLVLALEFLLAADILKSAISPTWNEIGQLAAIAAIRTFLNYSLGHDLQHTPETTIR